jgi:hypothetical protein
MKNVKGDSEFRGPLLHFAFFILHYFLRETQKKESIKFI